MGVHLFTTPDYGLCNRLRGYVGAWAYAKKMGCSLHVLWTESPACPYRIEELFEPLPNTKFITEIESKETTYTYTTNDLGHLSHILAKYGMPHTLAPILIASLVPVVAIRQTLNRLFSEIPLSSAIGLHIRRTDHVDYVNTLGGSTQLDIFWKIADAYPMNPIYLACDDSKTLTTNKSRYGNRIHIGKEFSSKPSSSIRNTDGEHAVLDIYCLALCGQFQGSRLSSFSAHVEYLRQAWSMSSSLQKKIFETGQAYMDPLLTFRKDSGIVYPPFSQMYFEKHFYNYMMTHSDTQLMERYIPIFWTENQISNFTPSVQATRQQCVDSFTKKKGVQYFTVVQHDDGITHTRIQQTIVFGMGGVGHIPLPLTYENPSLFESFRNTPKTIFCSFMGSITHPCRMESCRALNGKPGVVLNVNGWTNQIPEANQKQFIEIMSQSRFTLAPRGYGKSSFRMYEALNLQSIPVYVYDEPWLPYTELLDWKKMAVLIHVQDISTMYETLQKITDQEVADMLAYYEQHKHLFTYDGMCEYIIQKIRS